MNGGHGRYQVLHTSGRVAQRGGESTPGLGSPPGNNHVFVDETKHRGIFSWPASLSQVRSTLTAGRCAGARHARCPAVLVVQIRAVRVTGRAVALPQ